jgi:copper chaperone CopZ
MTCGHCVQAVRSEVESIRGVRGVSVDLATGHLAIAHDRPLEYADIAAAVAEAGYALH